MNNPYLLLKYIGVLFMKIAESVSYRVKEILEARKMTQYRLEQLTGISHNTMSSLLNCRYESCNLKTIFIIIEALDLSIHQFFNSPAFEFFNLDIE